MKVYNLKRYKGKHPSTELVRSILTSTGLSMLTFELIYDIPRKQLQRFFKGQRDIPPRYWHIFYEFGNLEKFYSNFKVKTKRKPKQKAETPAQVLINEKNKSIIDALRSRIT